MNKKDIYSIVGAALSLAGIAVSLIAGNFKGKAAEIDMRETVAKEVAKQLSEVKGS